MFPTKILLHKIDKRYIRDAIPISIYKMSCSSMLCIPVKSSSPKKIREELSRMALYFKRECHNGLQYHHDSHHTIQTGYLFVNEHEENREIFGGCVFSDQFTTFENVTLNQQKWWLDWIWIHPWYRNMGIFKIFVESFAKKNHPGFLLEKPLSRRMAQIDEKNKIDGRYALGL